MSGCGRFIRGYPCCTVVNEDCREFTSRTEKLPEDCVVITDPPYGISHPCDFKTRGRAVLASANDYPDVFEDNVPFSPEHILSLDVPTVLWGGNHFASRLPDSGGWLVWDKNRPDDFDQATCELAWTNFVKGVRRLKFTWHGMVREADFGIKDALVHPTQKPVALTSWILGLRWTPPGTVIDFYAGSGSALVAAARANRHYLGFEVVKEYCELAERWLAFPRSSFNPLTKDEQEKSKTPTLWSETL